MPCTVHSYACGIPLRFDGVYEFEFTGVPVNARYLLGVSYSSSECQRVLTM